VAHVAIDAGVVCDPATIAKPCSSINLRVIAARPRQNSRVPWLASPMQTIRAAPKRSKAARNAGSSASGSGPTA
jgi:hypothetical protein